MDFITETNALKSAVTRAAAITDTKSTVPVVACIRIAVQGGVAAITASNVVTMRRLDCEVPVGIDAEGEACISAEDFGRWAASLPDGGQVRIRFDPENEWQVLATCGRRRHRMLYLPVDGFPDLAHTAKNDGEAIKVNPGEIADAIVNAAKAAAKRDFREYLNAVHFEGGAIVATDAKRLHHLPGPEGVAGLYPVNVISDAVAVLRSDDSATMWADGDRFRFKSGPLTLNVSGLADQYPDWKRLDKDTHPFATCHRDELAEAIDACTLGAPGAVTLTPDGDGLSLTHKRAKSYTDSGQAIQIIGDGHADVSAEVHDGEKAMTLNGRYLKDALSIMPVGDVSLEIDPKDPLFYRIRPAQDDVKGRTFALIIGMA